MINFLRSGKLYRRYSIDLRVNGKNFKEVWIDPYYELKHKDSVDDQLILNLVQAFDGWLISLSAAVSGFEFYEAEGNYEGKAYRVILVIPADGSYLGVRNAYRRSK